MERIEPWCKAAWNACRDVARESAGTRRNAMREKIHFIILQYRKGKKTCITEEPNWE